MSKRFLVVDRRVLEDLRARMRNDLYRFKAWRQLSEAVSRFGGGGRRSDFAIFDGHRERPELAAGLTIVLYRERLGETPEIVVEPVFDLTLRREMLSEPNTTRLSAFTEVASRVAEIRAAATASAAERIDVRVVGDGDLAREFGSRLRMMVKIGEGVPVFLDGVEVERPGPSDRGPAEGSPLADRMAALLLRWDGYDENDAELLRALKPYEDGLALARDTAWRRLPEGSPPDARSPVTEQEALAGDLGDRIVGYAEGIVAGSDVAKFAREHGMGTMTQATRRLSNGSADEGRGITAGFARDARGELAGFFTLARMRCARLDADGRLRIGYAILPSVHPVGADATAAHDVLFAVVRRQTADDLRAILDRVPPGTTIEVGGLMRKNIVNEIHRAVEVAFDDLAYDFPDAELEIGTMSYAADEHSELPIGPGF